MVIKKKYCSLESQNDVIYLHKDKAKVLSKHLANATDGCINDYFTAYKQQILNRFQDIIYDSTIAKLIAKPFFFRGT